MAESLGTVHAAKPKPALKRPAVPRAKAACQGRMAGSPSDQSALLECALAPVKRQLKAVTERILSQLTDPVARMVTYLVTAGGKRLRPALVLLAGASGASPDQSALLDMATAAELIHTATLIHDDIIDRSPLRRSQPTFHHRWGTERAVLMGDYLYATAFTLLARLERPYVTQVMADVCQQLCRGELREVEARYRLDLTEAEYLDLIRDKTASLIGGCCRTGAYLGGCDPDTIARLAEFGINFGLAFQIMDDCLDLIGDQRRLGKSILADLDKGTLSLPIIYLTQRLSTKERDRLFAPLRRERNGARQAAADSSDPAFLARVAAAARSSGAIAQAHARAGQLIHAAQEALSHTPMNGLALAYEQLARYAIARTS
ncbi:MAG: polyprenyl synthetase family protein [Candidatus Omnitrophica bacterium]|nr:polyprenyl synthetase family protein [Candidatus Omnitrophota bacterium]